MGICPDQLEVKKSGNFSFSEHTKEKREKTLKTKLLQRLTQRPDTLLKIEIPNITNLTTKDQKELLLQACNIQNDQLRHQIVNRMKNQWGFKE